MELTRLTVAEAQWRLGRGSITPVDLAEAYLARIESLDHLYGAYLFIDPDSVRLQAEASAKRYRNGERRSAIDGIPIACKDNIDIAGWPTTNGTNLREWPREDAALVHELRSAGAVLLGKVNMHEAALGGTTNNPHYGPTQNPWRLGFTPGGSSGGSAAAVAGELCAAAMGSDTMGSIRLPASYCGIVGMKPSRGRVSNRGTRALCHALDTFGPMARTVEDAAWVLNALQEFDPKDPNARNYGTLAPFSPMSDLRGISFGVITNFAQVDCDIEVRSAFKAAEILLCEWGATVRPVPISAYDPSSARRAGLLWIEAEGAVANEILHAEPRSVLSPEVLEFLDYGAKASSLRLLQVQLTVREAGHALRRALTEVDFLISPTTAQTAFSFDTSPPVNQADITALANFGGCPALSLPCALSQNRLPIGFQVIGTLGDDARLLNVASTIERAFDFTEKPTVSGLPTH